MSRKFYFTLKAPIKNVLFQNLANKTLRRKFLQISDLLMNHSVSTFIWLKFNTNSVLFFRICCKYSGQTRNVSKQSTYYPYHQAIEWENSDPKTWKISFLRMPHKIEIGIFSIGNIHLGEIWNFRPSIRLRAILFENFEFNSEEWLWGNQKLCIENSADWSLCAEK